MKTFKRNLVAWATVAALLLSAVLLAICFVVARDVLPYVAVICASLVIPFVLILLCVCAADAVHYVFDQDALRKQWAALTLKRVPYEHIGCIAIMGAIHHPGYTPVLDKDKKPCAAMLLYPDDIYHSFTSKQRHVFHLGHLGLLYQDALDAVALEVLLTKTDVPVYITESMLTVHQEKLNGLVCRFPDRFFVAYYDRRREHERKLPYQEYILYIKEISQ